MLTVVFLWGIIVIMEIKRKTENILKVDFELIYFLQLLNFPD